MCRKIINSLKRDNLIVYTRNTNSTTIKVVSVLSRILSKLCG